VESVVVGSIRKADHSVRAGSKLDESGGPPWVTEYSSFIAHLSRKCRDCLGDLDFGGSRLAAGHLHDGGGNDGRYQGTGFHLPSVYGEYCQVTQQEPWPGGHPER
jgi:hypothetical protein